MAANSKSNVASTPVPEYYGNSCGDDASEASALPDEAFKQDGETSQHVRNFTERTGMTPHRCWLLVLSCMVLRIIGFAWMAMVILEYTRYYVVNDLNIMTAIDTAIKSPVSIFNALIFPVWGRFADQSARKPVLVTASILSAMSVWLLTILPSMETYVTMRVLGMVAEIHGPIHNAMLRDLFSSSQWDHQGGGITGLKSKMAIIGTIATGVAIAIGMAIMFAGDRGIGLANEYTRRKSQCSGQKHCVPRGQFSWEPGGWYVDGSLRLLMLMGAILLSIEALVVMAFLPETISKHAKTGTSFSKFFITSWRENVKPWNNLKVFATEQLRALIVIRFFMYVVGSGGSALFMTWYRRTQLDTFTMYSFGVAGGAVGFLLLCLVKHLVQRFGDLRAIWIPSTVLSILSAICVALVPGSAWQLYYAILPLFFGPASALAGFTPELLSKLIPPDVQATFQTGKSFLWNVQQAVFLWPWLGVFMVSEKMPYPLDALSVWIGIILGGIVLCLTIRELRRDPANAIREGNALDPFWKTDYAQGRWYRVHKGEAEARRTSRLRHLCLENNEDSALPAYLHMLERQPWRQNKLSVVFYFSEDNRMTLGQSA